MHIYTRAIFKEILTGRLISYSVQSVASEMFILSSRKTCEKSYEFCENIIQNTLHT